jgi:gliding motility-associated-like protein
LEKNWVMQGSGFYKFSGGFFHLCCITALAGMLLLFAPVKLFSQPDKRAAAGKTIWTTNNPFQTDVFIKNYGQFDKWVASSEHVKYAINNAQKIFFTQNGMIYNLAVIDNDKDEKGKRQIDVRGNHKQEEQEHHVKIKHFNVYMQWEGCNPYAIMEPGNETSGYYTYGEKGYENIRAKGYKKLTYKNLYPGIDVEYIFPDASTSLSTMGGIKYQLIVHPGANAAVVKMHYSGDVTGIEKDAEGNLLIKTPAGNITDHAPASFYNGDKRRVESDFSIEGTTISFMLKEQDLQNPNTKYQNLIIDPWTTVPASLQTNEAVYDADVDDYGNIYISGGSEPFKTAKYNSNGALLWTFTNPATWGDFGGSICYSRFCILNKTGTLFIGECCYYDDGPRIMKINSQGTLVYTSNNLFGNEEIWVMFYNRCTSQLIGFGGGTFNPDNIQIISDTNLLSSMVKNFTVFTGTHNDVATAKMDINGDFYALISSVGNMSGGNNHLVKSLTFNNYNPPPAFNVLTDYNFQEYNNIGLPINSLNEYSVRANALALNDHYLFTYDGKTINAWDKNSGTSLGFVVVDQAYLGGTDRHHEGITVDGCNNVYVGGSGKVHTYSFNGSAFTTLSSLTQNIPGEVFDVNVNNSSGILYVSGLGFLTTFEAMCPANGLDITVAIEDSCLNIASVTASSGTPPYNYHWSNGATTTTITNVLPGSYTVTVGDNSCNGKGYAVGEITIPGCPIIIPNVFTPNSDKVNDYFEIIYKGFEPYHLVIFNRWGKKVFESNDKTIQWNGKIKNIDAADGVYYYVLDIGSKAYNGTITLIR